MKKKVAFVCVHNSCRNQIAEALVSKLGSDSLEAYSAGTELQDRMKEKVGGLSSQQCREDRNSHRKNLM